MPRSHRLAFLALSVLAAPSMSRNADRGSLGHRPVRNSDGGAAAGKAPATPTTPAAGGPAGGPPPAGGENGGDPPVPLTQADLERAVARATAALTKKHSDEIAALRGRLPADDQQPPADAAAREAAAKREREKATKELEEARALAATERTRRHAAMLEAAGARATTGIDFVGRDAADVVANQLRSMLRVDDLGDGKESVTLVDGKTEIDVADGERVAAFVRKRFPSLIRAQSGAGAPHGGGTGGGSAVDFSKMSPAELIAHELKNGR